MHFTTPIALIALATLGTAAPSEKKPAPFQVTDLDIFQPTGRPGDTSRYTVGFNVTDPADNSRSSCTADWAYADAATGYPSKYVNCKDAAYAFKLKDYKSFNDFKIDVKHTSGKKPKKQETRFADGQVVPYENVRCVYSNAGFARCNQIAEFPLKVYDIKKN